MVAPKTLFNPPLLVHINKLLKQREECRKQRPHQRIVAPESQPYTGHGDRIHTGVRFRNVDQYLEYLDGLGGIVD